MGTWHGVRKADKPELMRLLDAELKAWGSGDEVSAITCRMLWAQLYALAGGIVAPALRDVSGLPGAYLTSANGGALAWRRRILLRPLVAITSRRRMNWIDDHRIKHCYYIESLACGHEREEYVYFEDQPIPRRRRCAECGDLRFAAERRPKLFAVLGGRPAAVPVPVHGQAAMGAAAGALDGAGAGHATHLP